MRLDKFLAFTLGITRKETPIFIKKNDVLVNGKKVKLKDYKVDEYKDEVMVNGNVLEYKENIYYVLNKPAGVVSAVIDNLDKTVVDLIDTPYDIFPIGRLDKDTVGIIILTNDGALSHALTDPNKHVDKKYIATVNGLLSKEEELAFSEGIEIKDAEGNLFRTKKANVELLKENNGLYDYLVTISEGKFHQVKRMFQYFDLEVMKLKRISFGPIELQDSLLEGQYRELTKEEIDKLKACQ